jgi:hypothetical protein
LIDFRNRGESKSWSCTTLLAVSPGIATKVSVGSTLLHVSFYTIIIDKRLNMACIASSNVFKQAPFDQVADANFKTYVICQGLVPALAGAPHNTHSQNRSKKLPV